MEATLTSDKDAEHMNAFLGDQAEMFKIKFEKGLIIAIPTKSYECKVCKCMHSR